MPNKDIQVVLGFDMETDIGSWTPYYNGLVNGTPLLLQLLSDRQLPATFFFTGEAARLHPEVVAAVAAAEHEIGCHSLYHENVGDALFEIPFMKPLLPVEVPHRLALATEWVTKVAGKKPVSFRGPRLFGSTQVVRTLEELGYVCDASYPLYFYGKQLVPYHPSWDDWTETGAMNLVEIPNFADMGMASKDPYGRDRDQWPLFRTEGASVLLSHIDSFIRYIREKRLPAVLCFYFHPWEFWEMPQGLIHYGEGSVIPDQFCVKNCGMYALEQLAAVIDVLLTRGAVFHTAGGLAMQWK